MTPAREAPLAELYRASGTVRGRTTIAISSKTPGYVRAVHVAAGDTVVRGQPLVDLEANDVQAGVSRAKAELEHATESRVEAASAVDAARALAELAKVDLDRVERLLASGAVTEQQHDDAATRWRAASAQLQVAEARLRATASGIGAAKAGLAQTQATLDYAHLVAPFAGRIVEKRVDPGAFAAPGVALLVLDDQANLRVEATVEESRGAALALGDAVTVEAAGRELPGTIGELAPAVDVASRGFTVKIDLAGAPELRPGTFARVSFAVGTRARLVVPTTSITAAGALDRVFVVEHGVARLRMITRGETQGDVTEVLSGLSADEPVVVAPPPALRDASPVEVRP